ncbi:MAG TPA: SDR family NAD(P)-dependent oxidoreductase, partial [Gammaproteobacteria bacterium]|nr:SDR family NAD(P)-dependent oxidoreductase [Gammaproteobacteria bacterium]
MKNLWSDSEAEKYSDSLLQLRVYSSRLLGRNPDLVLHGGGNTSVKITEKDIFGEDEEILYVKGSGWDLGDIEAEGFAPVRLKVLQHMATLDQLSDSDMVRLQRAAMTNPYAPNPSVEAVLHAIIPFAFVDHTHADAVVTITNTPGGEERIREIYGDRVLIVPYVMPGFILAKTIYEMTRSVDWSQYDGMVLLHHGVFTFDNDAGKSYEKMIDIVSLAEDYLQAQGATTASDCKAQDTDLITLARIRKQVAEKRDCAVYVLADSSKPACAFASLENVDSIAGRGPLTPDHIIRTKQLPLIVPEKTENAQALVDAYADEYRAYFDRHAGANQVCLDPAPRWAVWKDRGLLAFGASLKEAGIIADINRHTIKAIQQAEKLGGWVALPEKDLFDMEYWELEQAKLKKSSSAPEFQGKVALVTGAASGIGHACVEMLLEKGAAVAAIDINPAITTQFDSAAVLGIGCDVSDSAALKQAVEKTVQRFGGLDILVSNAGIFTANETIEDMSAQTWQLSMDINLTSHQRLMQYCIPYL